jgi:signal transduction histidine kinase
VEITTRNQTIISFRLAPNPAGYVNLYGRDVTERRRAEAEMRRNEGHWRGVFDGAPVPIWEEDFSQVAEEFRELRRKGVTDFRAFFQEHPEEVQRLAALVNVTAMNRASFELFGHPQSGKLPEPLTGYLSRRSKPLFGEELAVLAEGGTSFSDEVPVRDTSGNERVVQLFLSVMPGCENTLERVLVSFVDLTARKQAEELLEEARAQLEDYTRHLEQIVDARTRELRQSLEDLEAFSYTVSHDLRAPLRTLLGLAEALREECGDKCGERALHYLNRMVTASLRINSFIHDVLAFSRQTRAEVVLSKLNLSEVLREVIDSNSALHAAGIQIAERLPVVMGNRAALTTSFSNLLGNAVKFVASDVKPVVRIFTEPGNPDTPTVAIRIVVEDNGVGVPPEHRDRLFKMFQRLTSGYEGSGLGLAIVRKAVERMGGRAGYEPAAAGGSRFWIELLKG